MAEFTTADDPVALETAWRRCGELRAAAERAERRDLRLQAGFIAVSFLAVVLAALPAVVDEPAASPALEAALLVALILAAALLAAALRMAAREARSLLRSAAAEIESGIYFFATLLQGHDGRERWLLDRVGAIRRRVFEQLGYEPSMPGRKAAPPPDVRRDLLAREYLQDRVERQIERQSARGRSLAAAALRLRIATFAAVGAALLLAAVGGPATVLAALAAAAAISLFAFAALRRAGAEAGRRGEAAFALGQIRDHWRGLAAVERTGDRFLRLVAATERILTSVDHDAVPAIRRAVARLREDGEDLLERAWRVPAAGLDEALQRQAGIAPPADAVEETTTSFDEETATFAGEPAELARPAAGAEGGSPVKSRPHAFVVMPFGRKRSLDGEWIDFDRVYRRLIRPALLEAGFEPFRSDEQSVSGDILTDMFQELLLADLVIADLSVDNANVGVRHAMRKRGVVHIRSGRSHMPFDVFNVRTEPYHCDAKGRPDPAFLDKDRKAIVKVAREEARRRLDKLLDRLGAGEHDLAITASAACGGDILFIEACLRRGMRVKVYLPCEEAEFVERSVGYAGGDWIQRFYRLRNHPDVAFRLQKDRVGPAPEGVDPYERSNRWALYSALGCGIDRVRLVLLWDGKIGDEPGGAHEMLQLVRSHGGAVEHLDTTKFEYWRTEGDMSGVFQLGGASTPARRAAAQAGSRRERRPATAHDDRR